MAKKSEVQIQGEVLSEEAKPQVASGAQVVLFGKPGSTEPNLAVAGEKKPENNELEIKELDNKESSSSAGVRSWGEVRLMRLVLGTEDTWVDIGIDFPSGSTREAEQYLEKMISSNPEEPGGKFMVIRRVKRMEARVETIRQVQFFES